MSELPPKYQILIDSDAFVGWLYEHDSHHANANNLFTKIMKARQPIVTTNYVVAETATVLSSRQGQPLARKFLDLAEKLPVLHIDDELHKAALDLFSQQERKRTSVVDCSNVVVMQQFAIPKILSFDKVYPKKFGLETVA